MQPVPAPAKLLLLCFFIAAATATSAQKGKPDMKDVQAQMAKAQHMLDSIQKAIPGMMPKGVKLPPGVKIPASATNGSQMPDLKKLGKDIDAGMANVQKYTAQAHAARDAGVPKKSTTLFSSVPNADKAAVIALAKALLPTAIAKLRSYDPVLQQALDTLIAKDTSYTPQAQGMLMLSAGAPKYMAQYMICKGVLLDPDNPWAINDLGIMYRGDGRNKEAAQCFRYAYSFNDTFLLIKCNLAWAVAYMGDFSTAKKYFQEILTILPDYNSAWEGLGMIAYQEGDIATLFQCLSKQIKTVGAGGDGPSEEFTGFVDGVIQDEAVDNMGKGSSGGNKLSDHTLDNDNGEEEANQDEPPTAYAEPPNYPESMGAMFPNNIDQMAGVMSHYSSFTTLITKKSEESKARVKSLSGTLPPISPPTYKDDQGMKVTPASSKKYFTLFRWAEAQFAGRVSEVYGGFYDDEQKLILSVLATNLSFSDACTADLKGCAGLSGDALKACEHEFYCRWKPKARGMLGANLGAISVLWTKYNSKLVAQTDWLVAATTPYIKRVHNVKWNGYMNAIRQDDIRSALLNSYSRWLPLLGAILNTQQLDLAGMEITCITPLREIPATGPDPKDVKLKKLKTAPDYCDPKEDVSFSKGPLVLEYTCQHTAVGLSFGASAGKEVENGTFKGSGIHGNAALGIGIDHVISQRHKEDDYIDVTTSIAVGGDITGKAHAGFDGGPVHASADGQVKAEASAVVKSGWRFDSEGNYLGRVKSADVSAGISSEGSVKGSIDGVGERSIEGRKALGFEYHGEVFAAAGSGYKVTKSSGGITH